MPFISIIVNCYNGDKHLRNALDSVIHQNFQNWELVFWDNQSTDQSFEIFSSFNDNRFKYFKSKTHSNLGTARIEACKVAQGEWIAFLDCDDYWLPSKLQQQSQCIFESGVDVGLVYCKTQIVCGNILNASPWGKSMIKYSKEGYPKKIKNGSIFNDLIENNFIPLVSLIVRKSVFDKVGGFNANLNYAEDYDLILKISKESKIYGVNEILCVYRVHSDNITAFETLNNIDESIQVILRHGVGKIAARGLKIKYNSKAKYLILLGQLITGFKILLFQGSLSLALISLIKNLKNRN
jgi:glycosyltransferase involved in cell wall biosynthesis